MKHQPRQIARLHIGKCEVDLDTRKTRCGGECRKLEPRSAMLLAALIEADGEVLSNEELIQRVWGHPHVSQQALHVNINRLRHALFDAGHCLIESLPRRGYRLGVRARTVRPPAKLLILTAAAACLIAIAAATVIAFTLNSSKHLSPDLANDLTRAETLFRQGNRESVRAAHALLVEIVRRAPDQAPAHHLLAETMGHKYSLWLELAPAEAAARAREHAQRAVELDPQNVAARLVQANLALFSAYDPQSALQILDDALTIEKDRPSLWQSRALALAAGGRLQDALESLATAEKHRPAAPSILRDKALLALLSRDWPAAEATLEQARVLGKDPLFWLEAFMREGRHGIDNAASAWLAYLEHAGCDIPTDLEDPENIYNWMLHTQDGCVARERIPWHAATWAVGAGNTMAATRFLCDAAAEGDIMFLWLAQLPVFTTLRDTEILHSLSDLSVVRDALAGKRPSGCDEGAMFTGLGV